MTTFEKLKLKIEKDTGLKVENLQRTFAGPNMLSSGAFTWIANLVGTTSQTVASQWSATELLKKKKISTFHHLSTIEIWPD